MTLSTVIFDMDGLLIDSEPCWEVAGKETLQEFGVTMSTPEYHTTTGLRTREWIEWWFDYYGINKKHARYAETTIVSKAIDKIRETGKPMPGVSYIFDFFKSKGFTIGLATSSPVELVKVVAEKLQIRDLLDGFSSAEELVFGKPHPEVYLNCAALLKSPPLECVCFEDSVNGMVAAKAARMKCVVVPAAFQRNDKRFGLADLQLNSLEDFSDALFEELIS
jgi:mannitol-1-/sugar-/sorbitol-6-/2-deoxyglucose-6-phosphatase